MELCPDDEPQAKNGVHRANRKERLEPTSKREKERIRRRSRLQARDDDSQLSWLLP